MLKPQVETSQQASQSWSGDEGILDKRLELPRKGYRRWELQKERYQVRDWENWLKNWGEVGMVWCEK